RVVGWHGKPDRPGVVGVPVVAPVLVASERPAGSDPGVAGNVLGPVPPLAVTVWLYAVPCVPAGRLDGFTTSPPAALMVIENVWVPVLPDVSVAYTVKVVVCTVVGVPEIVPELLSDRPAGSVPLASV